MMDGLITNREEGLVAPIRHCPKQGYHYPAKGCISLGVRS